MDKGTDLERTGSWLTTFKVAKYAVVFRPRPIFKYCREIEWECFFHSMKYSRWWTWEISFSNNLNMTWQTDGAVMTIFLECMTFCKLKLLSKTSVRWIWPSRTISEITFTTLDERSSLELDRSNWNELSSREILHCENDHFMYQAPTWYGTGTKYVAGLWLSGQRMVKHFLHMISKCTAIRIQIPG